MSLNVPGSSLWSFKDGERCGNKLFSKKCNGLYNDQCSEEKEQINPRYASTLLGYCNKLFSIVLKERHYIM